MRDLIVKLETLKESKERKDIVSKLRDGQAESNKLLLEGKPEDAGFDPNYYSEAEMIRHEIKFISKLIGCLKVKDTETKKALVEDLENSMNWRINRLLGKTHEYGLDNVVYETAYTTEDLYRSENRWIECFDNLPSKLVEKLKVKEEQEVATSQAEVQEQIDALSQLEVDGI